MLRELELKKEKELRDRIEKDQIRKELANLEKEKLNVLGDEKKKQLLKVENDRNNLMMKEKELLKELEQLELNN